MKSLWLALGFLTSIPAPQPDGALESVAQRLGRAARWFPVVGLLLGVLVGYANEFLGQVFPPLLAAALVVALWVALTGGLHLDGLADCFDGLLASVPPKRRLEIMRDSRLGAFGGLGLFLVLILKVAAVAALQRAVGEGAAGLLPGAIAPFILAAVLARWVILPVARQSTARPGGLGADFAAGLNRRTLFWAAVLPLALLLLGGWYAFASALFVHLLALGVARLARARLGGVTGDVLGLTVELVELAVLLVYAGGSWGSD